MYIYQRVWKCAGKKKEFVYIFAWVCRPLEEPLQVWIFSLSYFILQHTISHIQRDDDDSKETERKKSVKLKTHHKRREFQFDTFFFLAARSLSRIWDVKTSIKLSLCFYLLAKGGKGKGKYVRISVGLFKSFNSHDTNTPNLPNDERRANRTRNEHSSDPWKTWSFSCCFWHGAAQAQKWNWIHFKMSRRKKREKGVWKVK